MKYKLESQKRPINQSSNFSTICSKGILFIHIPKTAGSSISNALGFKNSAHSTIEEARNSLGWIDFHLNFKFAFVRNPWDRFLSLYRYARMPESRYHSAINTEKAPFGKHSDYDLLKDASLEECANYLIEGKLKHDSGWNHWQPQINWLQTKKGKIPLNFIGRYETLNADFKKIQKKLRITKNLNHINASSKEKTPNYRDYYNQNTKEIINSFYKADINHFKYNF